MLLPKNKLIFADAKRIWTFILIGLIFQSCKIEKHDKTQDKISFWFIIDSKNQFLRLDNLNTQSIFLPSDFELNYSETNDTIFLEQYLQSKYEFTKFYQYNNLLKDTIWLRTRIENVKPDTTFEISKQTIFKNAFRISKLIEIKAGESFIDTFHFDHLNPRAKFIRLRFFNKPFVLSKYTFQEYLEFEKSSSFVKSSKIYY